MPTLAATTVVTPTGLLTPGQVTIESGRIVDVRASRGAAPDRVLAPGFVDLQVNGHDDVHVAAAEGADWERLDLLLVEQGVTAWCPTLTTAPLDSFVEPLARIARAAARGGLRPAVIGAHLEGPFLGGAIGAHPREHVRKLDLKWLETLPDVVRVVTLAPELPAAVEAVRALAGRGVVVSLGHSTASYEECHAATGAGARMVTHLFNGMAPFHHRRPGLVGAALSDPRLTPSLIADGVHVHPAALRAAARAKGAGGWILVTDAVGWRDERSGLRRELMDGAPRLVDGTIAGSSLRMDAAVAHMVNHAGVALVDAVLAAATTPARLIDQAHDRGAVAPGRRADLVALDPATLTAQMTWIGGEPAR